MIIFNITIKADLDIHQDFMSWVRAYTGLMLEGSEQPSKIYRLMNVDATDGITYCLQHYFVDMAAYNTYISRGDLSFREEMSGRYGDKLVVFSSVLTEV